MRGHAPGCRSLLPQFSRPVWRGEIPTSAASPVLATGPHAGPAIAADTVPVDCVIPPAARGSPPVMASGSPGSGFAASGAETSAMVELAVRWAPYGGPPESAVYESFGITATKFKREVAAAVDRSVIGGASPPPAALLAYLRRPTVSETQWGT